jgi:two-component system, NtrC family, sensor histidine kinase HydH
MHELLDELFDYIGFTPDDASRLRALHPRLAPSFSTIADEFYDAIRRNPAAAAVLSGPPQGDRLRATLIDWMSSGLRGPYDEQFYAKRSRIGGRHVEIGLPQRFMFAAMNVVRSAYRGQIARLFPPDEAYDVAGSVDKLLDVELAIMVEHYKLDSDEKLLTRERDILTERITAMQTLSAGLAHEVRNPLNAAKLQLELLERRVRRAGEDARLLEPSQLAQKEIERLTILLGDFLSFARPPERQVQPQDVAAIVRQVAELEAVVAERRQATLVVKAPPRLDACVDGGKIHQVILNLVRNAIEAVSAGGCVTIELAGDDDWVRVSVSDDGPGIPEHARRRIYEPFFSTKEGGTGLGMSIVHSLVSLHGGSIEVQTGVRGTRFNVALPRRG